MNYELTTTFFPQIHAGQQPENPVLQVVGMKEMNSAGNKRVRLLLSDGISTFGSAMLATQLNSLVDSGEISANCIICIKKYTATKMQGSNSKLVVIIIDIEIRVSGEEVGAKIGSAVPYKASNYDHLPKQTVSMNGNHSANRSSNGTVPLQNRPMNTASVHRTGNSNIPPSS